MVTPCLKEGQTILYLLPCFFDLFKAGSQALFPQATVPTQLEPSWHFPNASMQRKASQAFAQKCGENLAAV
jgi:hypothetical protein